VPRIIGRVVNVPATVTVIAVLVGGGALGLIGALIGLLAAAAIDIVSAKRSTHSSTVPSDPATRAVRRSLPRRLQFGSGVLMGMNNKGHANVDRVLRRRLCASAPW
jgi:hypothetical protein